MTISWRHIENRCSDSSLLRLYAFIVFIDDESSLCEKLHFNVDIFVSEIHIWRDNNL